MRGPTAYLRVAFLASLASLASACERDAAPSTDTAVVDTQVAVQPSAPAPDTSRPVFEIDLWPGEGIPILEAATETLVLRRRPSPAAPVAHEMRVALDQRVSFDSARYQTMTPARLRVLAPFNILGRVLGNVTRLTRTEYYSSRYPRTSVAVDSTSALEFLQNRAEGSCFVRLDGRVIDADDCPATNRIEFALDGEPETRLWVRLVEGSRAGWVLVTDSTLRIAGRQF